MRVFSPAPLPASHCGTMDTWGKQNRDPHSHPQPRCPGQLVAPPSTSFASCFFLLPSISDVHSEGWKWLLPLRSCCASLCAFLWRSAATLRNLIPPTLMNLSTIRTHVKLVRYWSIFSLFFLYYLSLSLSLSLFPSALSLFKYGLVRLWERWRPKCFWLWTIEINKYSNYIHFICNKFELFIIVDYVFLINSNKK